METTFGAVAAEKPHDVAAPLSQSATVMPSESGAGGPLLASASLPNKKPPNKRPPKKPAGQKMKDEDDAVASKKSKVRHQN